MSGAPRGEWGDEQIEGKNEGTHRYTQSEPTEENLGQETKTLQGIANTHLGAFFLI